MKTYYRLPTVILLTFIALLWVSFSLNAQNWDQIIKGVASDRADNDNFGYSVAISGDYAIVGAYQQDQDASGSSFMSNSGSAYIFKLTGSTWAQQQKILASDRAGDDYFGYSVAISGDYAIVGANWEDEDASGGATTPNAGSAYFFGESPCSPNTSSFSVSICESYTVPSGDETYTVSDTYMDTIPSLVNGCDSVMTIDVTILQPTTRSFSVSVCETYTVPSGDETYTVSNTYMDTIPSLVNGCDSVMTIDVTVLQPTSSSFSVSVCESYTVPSGDETYTVSDIYMDTIPSLVNGCDSVMTIDVTVNDLPDVGVTATDPTLTADAAGASYQWLDCDDSDAMIGGATDQAYMPLANGSFAVEVTENGCVDTSDCVSVFTVGIDNLKDELFQVYPNPTSNQVTIDLGSETSGSVRIFDVAGKTVYSEQITSSKATLDVSAIAEGVYTLQFVSETGLTKIQRVVKQ